MSFPSYRAVSKIGFCHITFCESTDLEKSNMFGKKNSLLSLVNKRQVLPPLPLGLCIDDFWEETRFSIYLK